MSISAAEFVTAMEVLGEKRLPSQAGDNYNVQSPCFKVKESIFLHSGFDYVIQRGKLVPDEIMNRAMAECGEESPGKDNFWYGEIHTLRGLLTLITLIEDTFSKDYVDQLINIVYKLLLKSPLMQKAEKFQFKEIDFPKMEKLRAMLIEYNSLINPFANKSKKLKEPKEYLDKLRLKFSTKDGEDSSVKLSIYGRSSKAVYNKDSTGWCYGSTVFFQKNRKNGRLSISHYYDNGSNFHITDEIVYLHYTADVEQYVNYENDVDLKISLKNGLAWQTYQEDDSKPVTEEQIDTMIANLNVVIKKIKHRIVKHMVTD